MASAVPGCSHEASSHEEVFKEAGDSSGLRETYVGQVKGLEMPGPASPQRVPLPQHLKRKTPQPRLPFLPHFLPRFLILSLRCCFRVSSELRRSYQTSSKFRDKILLQIPEGQPPDKSQPQASAVGLPSHRGRGWKMGGRWAALTAPPQCPTTPSAGGSARPEHRNHAQSGRPGAAIIFRVTTTHLPESRSGTQGASSSDAP